jgi:hypothetical protein
MKRQRCQCCCCCCCCWGAVQAGLPSFGLKNPTVHSLLLAVCVLGVTDAVGGCHRIMSSTHGIKVWATKTESTALNLTVGIPPRPRARLTNQHAHPTSRWGLMTRGLLLGLSYAVENGGPAYHAPHPPTSPPLVGSCSVPLVREELQARPNRR